MATVSGAQSGMTPAAMPRPGHLWLPHPKQAAFIEDRHRNCIVCAGAQGGKTIAAAGKVYKRMWTTYRRKGRALFWVVTPTYDLAVTPQKYLKQIQPNGWRRKSATVHLEWEPYPGWLVRFKSAEHPEKLISESVDGIWMNEAAKMKADAWRGGLRMRLNATNGWCIADTTPMGQNWVFTDLFQPGLREGERWHDPECESSAFRSFQWNSVDNPAVSEAEVEEARRTLPSAYFAREYEADFAAFHGQVYTTFVPEAHVVDLPGSAQYHYVVIGVDWGFALDHPGAIVAVGIRRSRVHLGAGQASMYDATVLGSLIEAERTEDWWTERLAEWVRMYSARTVWCDPARPSLIETTSRLLRAKGAGAAVRPANNDVWDGIMLVSSMFGGGRLRIQRGQKTLIRQLQNYRWETKQGTDETRERPMKHDDDGPDALRYALASELLLKRLSAA